MRGLTLGLFVVFVPLLLAGSSTILRDGDVSWHLATGQWILERGRVPTADPFSFTAQGRHWVAFEWLSDSLYALAFDLAGVAGLSALVGLALGLTLLIVGLAVLRHGSALQLATTLLLLLAALANLLIARPHVLAWPLLALWVLLLVDAADRRSAPPLAAALLMLPWVNLHPSFSLGLALIGPFAIEAVLDRGVRAIVPWALFGLASTAAALVNPQGLDGLLYPLHVSQLEMLPEINEWKPTSFDRTWQFVPAMVVAAGLLIALRVRVPPVRLLLILALWLLAMVQLRHQPVAAIVAAILLARPVAEALRKPGPARSLSPLLPLTLVAGLLLAAATRALVPMRWPDMEVSPWSAIAAVPDPLRDEPVLNEYGFGGPLILSGIRPYIDGRSDMYGDEHFRQHMKITAGDPSAFREAVDRWDIRWTIRAPYEAELIRLLDRDPRWRRIYADAYAVIHVRSDQPVAAGH